MEIWKDIPRTNGCYQISNFGNLRSTNRKIVNSKGKVLSLKGKVMKWNKVTKATRWYQIMCLFRYSEKCICISCHQEVAKAFIPNPENKPEVNHIDGNKINNHVSNLEWCTRLENMQHAYATGLAYSKGEACGMAKLTEAQVLEIRAAYKGEWGQMRGLGRKYGVSKTTIKGIVKRELWTHI